MNPFWALAAAVAAPAYPQYAWGVHVCDGGTPGGMRKPDEFDLHDIYLGLGFARRFAQHTPRAQLCCGWL